ncbi:low molecular weight phosphatase family protein [Microbacterium kribbense]|uniref:protein-tyrosine-phosphatase n=1 Tax=Microbacterium kribbense TaxID=433645 RepID=A0ABP7GFI7_9MICO
MFEILTVCTGNICRSPLAQLLLATRLADLGVHVRSAGTHGMHQAAMPVEAQAIAKALGVDPDAAAAHRSRMLAEADMTTPDLIFAMARDHRREIVELAPSRMRAAFTVREFARLAADISDDDLHRAADAAGADASARVRAAAALVASHRGLTPPPADPSEDDVVDPYGRSWETYEQSALELVPALDVVERVLRAALV